MTINEMEKNTLYTLKENLEIGTIDKEGNWHTAKNEGKDIEILEGSIIKMNLDADKNKCFTVYRLIKNDYMKSNKILARNIKNIKTIEVEKTNEENTNYTAFEECGCQMVYEVLGETYEIRNQLKTDGAKWNGIDKYWWFDTNNTNYETRLTIL